MVDDDFNDEYMDDDDYADDYLEDGESDSLGYDSDLASDADGDSNAVSVDLELDEDEDYYEDDDEYDGEDEDIEDPVEDLPADDFDGHGVLEVGESPSSSPEAESLEDSGFDALDGQVTIDRNKFSISFETVKLDDLAVLQPLKQSRLETYAGLLTSVKEMGILTPIVVTPTEAYVHALEEGTDSAESFEGVRYKVLDGFRRLYAATKLGLEEIPARVVTFKNTASGTDLSVVFALILNRTQKRSWKETWSLMQSLELQAAFTPASLEWLLALDAGDSLRLKDIMQQDEFPDIRDQFLEGKKTLQQAYTALQKARKEDFSQTEHDDKQGLQSLDGLDTNSVVDEQKSNRLRTDEEVKEILELAGISDEDFDSEEVDMFGEAAEDHVQDVKHRESLSPELRSAILRRDDFACQCCGFGKGIKSSMQLGLLQCHHITAVYTGGSDAMENFVTVCSRCHNFIHIMAGYNCKIGMTREEFAHVPPQDQDTILNVVAYARKLLAAEKASGKALQKEKGITNPFWVDMKQSKEDTKTLIQMKKEQERSASDE